MPHADRKPAFERLYSIEELIELAARCCAMPDPSHPPGAGRNPHRQVALSLRGLFKNQIWSGAHTSEDSCETS
jgi:hypothetical protein